MATATSETARKRFAALLVCALVVTSVFAGVVAFSGTAAAAPQVLYRVNAGGSTIQATDAGPDWTGVAADSTTYFNGDTSGDTPSGSAPDSIDSSVPASTPDGVFVNEIGDPPGGEEMHWHFDVPQGTQVEVRLYLADEHAQDRSFDLQIEGQTVLDDYDPNDDVGHNVGTMKSFTVTSDGTLNLDFFHGSGATDTNPFLNGLEIVQAEPQPDELGASPASVSFDTTVVGNSKTQSVQFTNLGETGDPDITLSGASITGTDPGAFSVSGADAVTLAPGESTTLDVTFAPSTAGAKAATLEVAHSGNNTPVAVPLSGDASSTIPVGFESSLVSTNISSGTGIDFGPDGRLYVAQESGVIKSFGVERTGDNDYTVTDVQEITAVVDDITNHNDDGSVYTGSDADERQITGILVAGTESNPVIYVSSSDPRFHFGGHEDPANSIETNSGVISRLTWNGSGWEHTQLVRGIARSSEAHSPNDLAINESSNTLYLAVGGHTMQGAPGNQFSYLPEYATSGAILSVDLAQVNALPTQTDADGDPYKYDLPTLQPNISQASNDAPWGGMDGRNMGMLTVDGPVQVYSPGYRNPYDVVITEDGQMYATDNGPDGSGGTPPDTAGGLCTNGDGTGSYGTYDQLHYIPNEGFYAGHPNPTRAAPDVAGLYDPATGADVQVLDFNESFTPVPFSMADPRQCDYKAPLGDGGYPDDGSIAQFGESTNGLTEYTASNFGGEMQGDLLVASFDNTVHRVQLSADGTEATSNTQIFSGFGSIPLDVTAQGDDEKFPGTVWVVRYSSNPAGPGFGGSDGILAFEPNDYNQTAPGDTCTGADDPTLDEDGDGFDNADELDAGTDPCSAASQPGDWDGDKTSNLNDPDDDNDGIPDTTDPFAIDADNGVSTTLPVDYQFQAASYPETLLGLGFTGLMSNGTDYADLYESSNIFKGGASGDLVVNEVDAGDAGTPANDLRNGFQFGVNTPDEPFTVHTVVQDPFPDDGGTTPQGGTDGNQQVGIAIGDGTQYNWTKLVVTAHGGDGGFEFTKEVDDSLGVVANPQDSAVVGSNTRVHLWLHVDPANETVTAEYQVEGNSNVTVGTTSIPSSWLDESDGQGMAVTTYSTTNGYPTFPATWDFIEVTPDAGVVNQAPSASFSVVPSVPNTGEDVVFDASGSSDSDGSIASYEWDFDNDGTTDATGQQVIHNFSAAGDYQVTLTVTDDDGDFDTTSQVISVSESTQQSEVVYRVNSGGPEVAAGDGGPAWSADTESNPTPYRVSDDEVYSVTDPITFDDSVPDGTPEAIFQSERWDGLDNGSQNWEFPVTAGQTYEVNLYFAEIAWDGPNGTVPENGGDEVGPRVFDVEIEGDLVLDDYEIHEDVGHDVGTVKSYTVTPTDDTLNIDLLHVHDDPKTSAIEIRAVESATNQPPVPSIAVDPQSPTVGQNVTLDATASSDPDGSIQSYAWDWNGDGQTDATGQQVTHAFASAGDHQVTLTVTDDGGENASTTTTVTVVEATGGNLTVAQAVAGINEPFDQIGLPEIQTAIDWWASDAQVPDTGGETISLTELQGLIDAWETGATVAPANEAPTASFTANVTNATVGDPVAFDASGSSDADGSIASYAWDWNGDGTTDATGQQATHTFASAGDYQVTLTVTDDDGATDTATVAVAVAEAAAGGQVLYRLNAGGSTIPTIDDGPDWTGVPADSTTYFNGDTSGDSPSRGPADSIDDTVPNSTPPEVFASEIGDAPDGEEMHWHLDVPDGETVQVRLYFADTFTSSPGERQFDLTIEDTKVLDDYSIIQADGPGPNVGHMEAFTATSDGTLNLNFSHGPSTADDSNPMVNAIEVVTVSGGGNAAPSAAFDVSPDAPVTNETVTFDATPSGDTDGSIASYAWDWNGDGTTDATGQQATHTFTAAGDYQVTLTVTDDDGATDTATQTVTVAEPGSLTASALVELTTDNANGIDSAVSGGGGSYGIHVTNTGDVAIESVRMNHSATLLPDLVLDPNGTAGDSAGEGFDVYADVGGATTTSFQSPHNGVDGDDGWDVQLLEFTDFGPGEQLGYTVDMDPNSIKGATPPGPAVTGGTSGLELSGTVVTVEFANGETATTQVFSDGSVAGGQAVADATVAPAPGIDVDGVALGPAGGSPSYSGATVADAQQTVTVTGTPGATVHLLQTEAARYVEGNGLSGGYDVDPLEANKVIDVDDPYTTAYTATLDANGTAEIPVTLHNSTQEGGYNYFLATAEDAAGDTGRTSDVVVLKYDSSLANDAPTAAFTTNVTDPVVGQTIGFDATPSSDPDGSVASYSWNFDDDTEIEAYGQQVTHAFASAGDHQVTLTVTDDDGATGTATQTLTVNESTQAAPEVLYRVNAGGPNVSALAGGPDWSVDTDSSPSPYHNSGSGAYTYDPVTQTTSAVPSYVPLTIFESERGDPPQDPTMQLAFPVETGTTVDVRLYFADVYDGTSQPGDRHFNVSVEGQQVLTNYDIIANAGDHTGHMENFTVTSDGTVNLEFAQGTGADDLNPVIQGIEIRNATDGGSNSAPTASFAANQTSTTVGEPVAFDASGSSDLDGSIASYAWDFDGDGTTDATGAQVTHAFASAGDHQVTLTVTDDDGATDTATQTLTVNESTPQFGDVLYRVNAGGPQLAASDGPAWGADTDGDPSPYVNTISTYETTDPITFDDSVPDGTPADLFQTEHNDPPEAPSMQWSFPVTSGENYTVRLYFAETTYEAAGQRQFNVSVEGQQVLANYDIYATAGHDVGTVETFQATPTDGSVDVTLTHGAADWPKISGVEIVESSPVNQQPTAAFDAAPSTTVTNETVTFDASGSSDLDGSIASYAWDWNGDGTTDATGAQVTHAFSAAGDYQVTLTVTDDGGATDATTQTYTVTEPATGPEVFYRLNAGGSTLTATDGGPDWTGVPADSTTYFNGDTSGDAPPRGPADSIDDTVPNSTPDAVFGSEIGDATGGEEMHWHLDVPAGETVEVRLYYADSHWDSAGDRLFDVALEGTTVADDYDVVANSGPNVGHMESYTVTSDGTVDLDFFHGPSSAQDTNPFVNAIEVVNATENGAPYASASANATAVAPNETVAFDASASADLDGSIASYAWDFDGDGTTDATGAQVTHAFSAAGDYRVTLTVTDDDGATDTATVDVSVVEPVGGQIVYRVNAGGSQVAAGDGGPDWEADTGQYVVAGGETYTSSDPITLNDSVPTGTPTQIFKSERYPSSGGPHEWEFAVDQNGSYEVRLYFAEIGIQEGMDVTRVFDVQLENQTVLNDYDIQADVGLDVGTMKAYQVTPDDGTLDVDFISEQDNSKISAIAIIRTDNSTTS